MLAALLADADLATIGLSGVAGAGAAAVVWMVKELKDWRRTGREENREDEKTAIERYRELYKRQEDDHKECEERNTRLEGRISVLTDSVLDLKVSVTRAVGWIRYHSAMMKNNGLTFEPFAPDPPAEPPKS